MADLTISNLGKSYGDVRVLKDITFDIADGEFVIFVGPSGCGKSTLLRMIAGLEDISDGKLSIGGRVVNNVAAKDRDVAMVFQNYALYPHMTVAQNLGFSLRLQKAPKHVISEAVKEAANVLGLEALLDRYPRQLSGGQRQRVAMGRAIVRDPQVFLFDEPLSNLDAQLRVQMRAEIKELHQRLKTTIIYVTHDQVEAMTMADRIVVMRGGTIEQIGTPLELFDTPANKFVASFIGSPSMNLSDGQTVDSGFQIGDGTVFPLSHVPDGAATLGVRPEHILLDSESGVEAEVVVIEPLGSETLAHLRIGGEVFIAVFRHRIDPHTRGKIRVRIDEDHLHWFAEDGHRLN
ncbi:MAG: ABC transporter ATP-binding protein [Marinosulfonomonas sp.]